jgi:hypothetical protein
MAQLLERGHDPEVVARVLRLVDAAEFKRRQSAPGTKISLKAFGRDRRLPVTNRWRESLPSVREERRHDGVGAATAGRRPPRVRSTTCCRPRSGARSGRCSPPTTPTAAAVFEEAGIPVMLVGDSAGNVVLGTPRPCR